MRTRIPAFILAIVAFVVAACNGNKDTFVLHGTVQDGGNDSILVVGIDSRFERTDTIFLNKGQFKWTFRPDTVTALLLILPDGRRQPVFAEKGVSATLEIPAGNEKVRLSGGYCNDIYQSYVTAIMPWLGGSVVGLPEPKDSVLDARDEQYYHIVEVGNLVWFAENLNYHASGSGYENAIMVHISHLRAKIEDTPHRPLYIKNVRGAGYKFDA